MTTASHPVDPDSLAAQKVAEGDFAHAGDRAAAEHGEHHGFAHVSPISTLLAVFVALIALTVITWAVAFLETGDAEIVIALFIATIKAGLVCTWFMHLRYDKPLNTLLFVFSTVFLALFLGITMSDATQYEKQLDVPEYPETDLMAEEGSAEADVTDISDAAADAMEGRPE